MSDIAIRAEGLCKKFHIGRKKEKYKTLRDTLANTLTAPFRRVGKLLRGHATGAAELDETIWALKDVSFEIKKGEVVGIIGRNGAGKSTLLKILSRITEPSSGFAEIYGRVGSLLEVGTGFHQELTGRENIYLNGAILGMKRVEIDRKFDEIVAFAEVEKFIDTPVKHYSSGMYLRLAFAVAAHLEPEIMLVDEVLAVGDMAFQKKCLGKMGDIAKQGRTVLFVSHDMGSINRLSQRTLWIDKGSIRMNGSTEEVVSSYVTCDSFLEGKRLWVDGISNIGVDELKIYSVCIRNSTGDITTKLDIRMPLEIEIDYRINQRLPICRIGFIISTVQGVIVFETYDSDNERYEGFRESGNFKAKCKIPSNFLNSERYILSINAGIPNVKNLAFLEGVLVFDLEDTGAVGSHICRKRRGIIRPKFDWEVIQK